MRIHIDHYFHLAEGEEFGYSQKLNDILSILQDIKKGAKHMSIEIENLEAAVATNTALDDSIILLLNGIAAQIVDSAGDREKAIALAAELNAKSELLAAAIKANTPVEPEPPIE